MSYISITDAETREMLASIGAKSVDDLFADIPGAIRDGASCELPAALSEIDLERKMRALGSKNRLLPFFLGAGAYCHYIPSVVDQLASRSEFYTAYTPYQPEVSQGTLRAIFEFQTMICSLTGMDIANASMYDGATALAEAVFMSVRDTGKSRVVVSAGVHPHYREVLKTYAWANGIEIIESGIDGGTAGPAAIASLSDESASCVVVQSPNFFGCIEDLSSIKNAIAGRKIHFIVTVNEPLSMALLKSPGSLGADIVCGEARSFGNPVGFGGPMLGFLAARENFVRKMPGRLVGKSVDSSGAEAYVLTLQTREQHIRRERATSNICSNEGLCLLRAVIYLAYYGNRLRDLAVLNHSRAAYLKKKLEAAGFKRLFERPYFNEFVISIKESDAAAERLKENGFIPGISIKPYYPGLDDGLLVAATENTAKEDIDRFVDVLKKITAR